MNYDHLTFFIADLDDIPEEARTGNNLEWIFSTLKYSVIGTTQEIYDLYVKDSAVYHKVITKDLAVKGKHWWGEVRSEKSSYAIVDGITVKSKATVSEETIGYVVNLMKMIAKMNVEYEISQTSYTLVTNGIEKIVSSSPLYNSDLLQKIDNCTTIREINIIYEDYLGCELPRTQALELGLYDEQGKRIFNEHRTKPSHL